MSNGNQVSIQGTLQSFGPRPAEDLNRAPNITTYGDKSQIEMWIDLTNFPGPTTQPVPPLAIPAHSIIWGAWLETIDVATSGGAATLDIGTDQLDGTAIDANGLFAAVPLASFAAAGDRVVGAGAQIGTDSGAFDSYIVANFNTAAFTAGLVRMVVEYSPPSTAQSE